MVPKVAIEVATNIIQTGSSYRGYHEGQAKKVIQGGGSWNSTVMQATHKKKKLLVSAVATNLITVVTDMPINLPYDKTPY